MPFKKTTVPISILDFNQYIFCDFNQESFLTNSKFVKLVNNYANDFKYLNINFKNDIPYFSMKVPFCPECTTRKVVKYGFTNRILVFKETNRTKVKVQRYKCKKCGKVFQTDLSSFVRKNSNFTDDLKNTSKLLISQFLGSLNEVRKTIFKEFNVSVSHQTIENWLKEEKTKNKPDNDYFSGYYVFDVEWIKINGKWKYRHTLIDTISNQIIADKIYDKEDEKTIYHFLHKSTFNKRKIAITTDLDKKYSRIIEKLGFKHQLCIFHTLKSLNKLLKTYLKQNNYSKEESQKSWDQLKKLKKIFKIKNYKQAEKELQSLIYRKNEFTPPIYKIITKSIAPRYKNFIHHLKDDKIEKTSNKIENAFQKTMPKHKKRKFKTIKGIQRRINIKTETWNKKRKQEKQYQQSF